MAKHVDAVALSRVVDRCFEATLDDTLWPSVLDDLGAAAASTGAVMFTLGGRDRPSVLCSTHCAGPMDIYLASEWCAANPRLERAPSDCIHSDADFMRTESQVRGSTAFREGFLRKYDMGWFAGASMSRTAGRHVLLSVERALRDGPFEPEELRILDHAFRAMRHAIALVPSLDARLRSVLLDGLETSSQAAMVLGVRGDLLQVNATAAALLPRVFCVRRGQLRAALSCSAFDSFMTMLIASMKDIKLVPTPTILTAVDGAKVRLRGSPLPAAANDVFCGARALLLLDPLEAALIKPEELRSAFGISSQEARLAVALSTSFDLKQAGQAIGVGHETARTHLKGLFAKTGAKNQNELAALLARFR